MPASSDRPFCAREAAMPRMAVTTAPSCRTFCICVTILGIAARPLLSLSARYALAAALPASQAPKAPLISSALLRLVQTASALYLSDNRLRCAIEPRWKLGAERSDMLQRQTIEKTALQCQRKRNFVYEPQRCILGLGEDGADALSARDLALDLHVSYPAEPREHFKFQELSIIQPQRFAASRKAGAWVLPPTRLTLAPTSTGGLWPS